MTKFKGYAKYVGLLGALVYFVSYITRINYAAVLVSVIEDRGVTNAAASMALTASAITYGIGQLISGYLGDKVKPNILIFSGILVSVATNILLPLSESVYVMAVIWGVNGLAQAFMWPPLVKFMSNLLDADRYQKACVLVSQASSVGTVAMYLLAPVCVKFLSWEYVFYIAAVCAFFVAFVWLFASAKLEKILPKQVMTEKVKQESENTNGLKLGVWTVIGGVMLAIALQGILRDGVTNWLPTYLENTFHLGSSISILSGVVLPVFGVVSFQVVGWIYRKWIKNELGGSAVIFAITAISAFVLYFMADVSPVLSVAVATIITSCMHAVNFILICMVPMKLRNMGKTSFMTGLLNSCTYVGSAVSGYGMATIADNFGWNAAVLSWGIVAGVGILVCLLVKRPWKKLLNK